MVVRDDAGVARSLITLPNPASIALHRRLGFTHVGTFADAGYKHGAWHAVDWWQKLLAVADGEPPAL